MGDLSEVSKLAHSACGLFQQHGSPESGVAALDKAAKMLEATQPQQALELFRRAVDIITVGPAANKNNYKIVKSSITKRKQKNCTKFNYTDI